jgi:hypothetical protein
VLREASPPQRLPTTSVVEDHLIFILASCSLCNPSKGMCGRSSPPPTPTYFRIEERPLLSEACSYHPTDTGFYGSRAYRVPARGREGKTGPNFVAKVVSRFSSASVSVSVSVSFTTRGVHRSSDDLFSLLLCKTVDTDRVGDAVFPT